MAVIACTSDELQAALELSGHRTERVDDPLLASCDLVLIGFDDGPIAGPSWIAHLRASLGSLPIVVVCEDLEQAESALAEGASEVLRRPLGPRLLGRRITRALAEAQESDPSSTPSGARDLLPRLVEASPDPIVAADLKGRILVFSRAAEDVLGYSAEEVLGGRLHVGELYADEGSASRVLESLETSEERAVRGLRVRLRTRKGESIPVRLTASLVHDFSGRPVASVGVFRDERERERLSQRLQHTTDQLLHSEQRAASLNAVGATAFELNQPLTAISGILEMLLLDPDQPLRTRERLDRAMTQVARVADLSRELGRMTGRQRLPEQDILEMEEP
jgi:PAS domain S-box-containing protein